MSQYVIDVKNDKQAGALLRYLKSLDFIDVKPFKPSHKSEGANQAKAFLKTLPNQKNKEADVNEAVKSVRKKYGYQ